jgi:hypothetical protein
MLSQLPSPPATPLTTPLSTPPAPPSALHNDGGMRRA